MYYCKVVYVYVSMGRRLQKLIFSQLVKKLSRFYMTRYWTLYRATLTPFIPLTPEIHFNIILHARLSLPSDLFSCMFCDQNFEYISHTTMRSICSAHPILFEFITLIVFGEEYKL